MSPLTVADRDALTTDGVAALEHSPNGLYRQAGPMGHSPQLRSYGVAACAREQHGDGVAGHRMPTHQGGVEILCGAQRPHSTR
jgi:hypothetical protein